ncbi:hypothetical protein BC832DRAFT_542890 [Gaertneriomyces semiglobifer]|nr:hypothetical protein BC832DRAFT_542890 [Gaertneriomyces semiglobifer]
MPDGASRLILIVVPAKGVFEFARSQSGNVPLLIATSGTRKWLSVNYAWPVEITITDSVTTIDVTEPSDEVALVKELRSTLTPWWDNIRINVTQLGQYPTVLVDVGHGWFESPPDFCKDANAWLGTTLRIQLVAPRGLFTTISARELRLRSGSSAEH